MIDELKIIMETLGQATGAAKSFGFYWLTIELLKVIFTTGLVGSSLLIVYKSSSKIILSMSRAKSIRDIVLPENAYGDITTYEWSQVLKFMLEGSKNNE